ncbi:apoptosis-associated speck-like protein containing a CARD [Lepisosteus oculatus]|uniref:apoptosis-associated speck-like protein containing a CARD n=1 Tax=Lepisosteus oculatus TaxID=7918 RepID=UPI003722F8D2
MAKSLKDHIIDTLEELDDKGLKKFRTKLCDRPGEPKIRKGQIQDADALDLANRLVSTFRVDGAVRVTVEVLRDICENHLATTLSDKTKSLVGDISPSGSATGGGTCQEPAAPSSAPAIPINMDEVNFVEKHRNDFIQRVTQVEPLLDELLVRGILNPEMYSSILAAPTHQEKMRRLFQGPILSAGARGKRILYQILLEQQPFLIADLMGQ